MTLPTSFASLLESNRARLNARFAEARHDQPKLDGKAAVHIA